MERLLYDADLYCEQRSAYIAVHIVPISEKCLHHSSGAGQQDEYAAAADAHVHQDDAAGGDGCSDTVCLPIYAEVFYQGHHAGIRQRMRLCSARA